MKIKPITSYIILSIAVTLSGCSATNPIHQSANSKLKINHDTKLAALKGCAIGGGGGLLLGIMHGNLTNALKLGIAGCAVGGVASGAVAYHEQMSAARDLQAQAANVGLNANVETRQVQMNPQGKSKTVEALDRLTLPLDAKGVRAHDGGMQALLQKAARLADISSDPVTVQVFGPAEDRAWMSGVIKRSLRANSKTKLVETFSPTTKVILSPIPNGEDQ